MNPVTEGGPGESTDKLTLSSRQAEAIVQLVESAPHVRRRFQFFVWTQSQLQTLLPHQILVCGAYQRQSREVGYEVFHNVVLAPELLQALTDGQGPLMRALVTSWIEARGRPLLLDIGRLLEAARLSGESLTAATAALRDAGVDTLLIHGVARPQRPSEIESFFVFGNPGRTGVWQSLAHVELMLPHLHAIWQRVMAEERQFGPPTPPTAVARAPKPAPPPPGRGGVTDRETQILSWVREGKSNQQIAEILGISPLTVKNHVQKILRKLGASNRAQAVAEAMAQGLLDSQGRQA